MRTMFVVFDGKSKEPCLMLLTEFDFIERFKPHQGMKISMKFCEDEKDQKDYEITAIAFAANFTSEETGESVKANEIMLKLYNEQLC